ncbi:MAG: PLP-dependent aminotransferase family protein [Candidatus Bipolaricaulaceae bacterium]
MLVRLDRESGAPLYHQIRNQLRTMILSGLLPPGSRLPPSGELARELGVNRTTVVNAYRTLWSEGLVEGRAGGGTVVARPQDRDPQALPEPVPLLWNELLTERVPRPENWTERAMPKVEDDVIRFDWGSPPPDLFPMAAVGEAATRTLQQGPDALRYGPAEGIPVLREFIAQRLRLVGVDVAASQVLILTGSEQGIFVVAQALLRPGDGVVVEAPTYPGALRTFRSLGAQLHPVPVDREGMRLDVLEGVLAYQRPKLIYTVPTFHNPTGITMSLARRRGLVELAHRYRVPILEDHPYSDLRYEGQHVPLISALDPRNYVIYLSTFSKWLFLGLRVGWMVAPRAVAPGWWGSSGRWTCAQAPSPSSSSTSSPGRTSATSDRYSPSTAPVATRCWLPWTITAADSSAGNVHRAGSSFGAPCGRGSRWRRCRTKPGGPGWRSSPGSRSSSRGLLRISTSA